MALAHYYVDAGASGDGSGDSWVNGMSAAQFDTHVVSAAAGYTYWIKAGTTYTLTSSINTASDGSNAEHIHLIGVGSGTTATPPTAADYVTGTSRPLFNCGAYAFTFDNKAVFKNLRLTSSNSIQTLRGDVGITLCNCEIINTGTGKGVNNPGNGLSIANSYISTNSGDGVFCTGGTVGSFVVNTYIKTVTGVTGIESAGNNLGVVNCIFNGWDIGIDFTDEDGLLVMNNTFHKCTKAIDSGLLQRHIFLNNIFDQITDGIVFNLTNAPTPAPVIAGNNFHTYTRRVSFDNGVGEDYIFVDAGNTTNDPTFVAEGSDDFSLDTGSGCIDAGIAIVDGVG